QGDNCGQAIGLCNSVAGCVRAVAHRAGDVEALLAALHQLRRDLQWDACSPAIAHLAGVVVIGADAETCLRMRPAINGGCMCLTGLRFRHLVSDRNRTGNRQARAASVGEEIERRLCADLHLAHHVREKLQGRRGAYLATKTEHHDDRDRAQKKNHKKSAQHIYSSWTMGVGFPPVSSSKWRTLAAVNRGSRALIARKNPSLVTRLKRSQLNIG